MSENGDKVSNDRGLSPYATPAMGAGLGKLYAPAGRAQAYIREELTEKAGWTQRPRPPAVYPKVAEPTGPGSTPVSNAALWIASKGNKIEVTDRHHEKEWIAAFDALANALVSADTEVVVRDPDKREDGVLKASRLMGVAWRYYGSIVVPTWPIRANKKRRLKTRRRAEFWNTQAELEPGGNVEFVECVFTSDPEWWNGGQNDKLFLAGDHRPWRTHLRVRNEFLRARWPFHLVDDHRNRKGATQQTESSDEALREFRPTKPQPEEAQAKNNKKSKGRKPGPPRGSGEKSKAAKDKLTSLIGEGIITVEELKDMKDEDVMYRTRAKRTTAREARDAVVAQNAKTIPDK